MFKRGFDKFRNEIIITNILKTIRILKAHTKKDFSQIQWRLYKLQKGYRKLHYLPKQDKDSEKKSFKTYKKSEKLELVARPSTSSSPKQSTYEIAVS